MLRPDAVHSAKKPPPRRKTFSGSARAAAGNPAIPQGLPHCSNCGLPLLDVGKAVLGVRSALDRERRLVARLLAENETFRQSLSNEIYEAFNQQLVAALLEIQSLESLLPANSAAARGQLRTGLNLLRDALAEARRIANALQPPALDDFGVRAGVQYLLEEIRRDGGPAVEFRSQGELDGIRSTIATAAFRIAEELLRNACRHSGSKRVRLEIVCGERWLRIAVEDWGVGFDPAEIPDSRLGLRKVRRRARALGGRALIRSVPGQGSCILVVLPLAPGVRNENGG